MSLRQVTLDIFNCAPIVSIDGVEDKGDNGEGYMSSEPTEVCYVEGEMQHSLVWPAFFFFAVYGLGYPTFVFMLLFNKTNKEMAMEDQLVRMGASTTVTTFVVSPATVAAPGQPTPPLSPQPRCAPKASRTPARITPSATSSASGTASCTTSSSPSTWGEREASASPPTRPRGQPLHPPNP